MYQERASRVGGAFVWTSNFDGTPVRVLPDGCMDLLWYHGDILIAGPDTQANLFVGQPRTTMTGLRFASGFAPRVIGAPAHQFANQRVALDAVWPSGRVRRFVDRIAGSDDPGRALEDVALQLTRDPDERSAVIDYVIDGARGGMPIATIASVVGLSTRQLRRRCLDAFGYGAKTLTRIFRMMHAIELAQAGAAFADVAARAGYADQAHLAREVKELAGIPLGQLVSSGGNVANRSTELPSGS